MFPQLKRHIDAFKRSRTARSLTIMADGRKMPLNSKSGCKDYYNHVILPTLILEERLGATDIHLLAALRFLYHSGVTGLERVVEILSPRFGGKRQLSEAIDKLHTIEAGGLVIVADVDDAIRSVRVKPFVIPGKWAREGRKGQRMAKCAMDDQANAEHAVRAMGNLAIRDDDGYIGRGRVDQVDGQVDGQVVDQVDVVVDDDDQGNDNSGGQIVVNDGDDDVDDGRPADEEEDAPARPALPSLAVALRDAAMRLEIEDLYKKSKLRLPKELFPHLWPNSGR